MTEQEAIERLKCMKLFMQINDKDNESKFLEDDYEANDTAIESLEKQIPKELKKEGYFSVCDCGCEMNTFLLKNKAKYCPECGQAIKWQ